MINSIIKISLFVLIGLLNIANADEKLYLPPDKEEVRLDELNGIHIPMVIDNRQDMKIQFINYLYSRLRYEESNLHSYGYEEQISLEIEAFKKGYDRIGWVDLDGNGSREAILHIEVFGYCGSVGCNVDVLELRDNKLIQIGYLNAWEIWSSVQTRNGHKTLYSKNNCMFWNGKEYITSTFELLDGMEEDEVCRRAIK